MNLFLVELKLELYFLLGAVAFMAGWVPCIVWASYLLKAVSGSWFFLTCGVCDSTGLFSFSLPPKGRFTESSKAMICSYERLLRSLGMGTPFSFSVPFESYLVCSSLSWMINVCASSSSSLSAGVPAPPCVLDLPALSVVLLVASGTVYPHETFTCTTFEPKPSMCFGSFRCTTLVPGSSPVILATSVSISVFYPPCTLKF